MKEQAKQALAALYEEHGALHPERVVEAAESEESPLHSYFEWDDSEAARKHRLNQARQLIRLAVTVIPALSNAPVRAYVSLSNLRKTETGSYLATVDVLSDDERRAQMIADALAVIRGLEKRYRHIGALAPIWAAAAEIADASKQAA